MDPFSSSWLFVYSFIQFRVRRLARLPPHAVVLSLHPCQAEAIQSLQAGRTKTGRTPERSPEFSDTKLKFQVSPQNHSRGTAQKLQLPWRIAEIHSPPVSAACTWKPWPLTQDFQLAEPLGWGCLGVSWGSYRSSLVATPKLFDSGSVKFTISVANYKSVLSDTTD